MSIKISNSVSILLALLVGLYLGSLQHSVLILHRERNKDDPSDIDFSQQFWRGDTRIKSLNQKLSYQSDEKGTSASPKHDTKSLTQHPICQLFGNPTPTALSLWISKLKEIHKASKAAGDYRYSFSDFTAQLLEIVTPRLPRSTLSLPRNLRLVQHLLDQAYNRWQYLHNNGPFAPPIRMVVLGGSVLVGRNCRKVVRDLNIQNIRMPQRDCNWSQRLHEFVNNLFPGVFQVTKIAMGGTNTAVGSQIFQYNLLPLEAQNPDIVLNAYSTNDMHVLTVLEAQSGNQTLRDRVFEIAQEFVRVVMQRQPCREHEPLMLHLDDYIGNEQREVWSTTELMQSVQVLAQYYGFGSMSYSNVVRDLVYGDTKEYWFSPEGWWIDGTMEREIHPGMGMHIATVWIVAYNLLHITTTYCSIETYASIENPMEYHASITGIPLTGKYTQVPGKPLAPPQGLPPVLTQMLSLEQISEQWRSSTAQLEKDFQLIDCKKRSDSYNKCIFSWVSGLSLQSVNVTWIQEYFGSHQIGDKSDWILSDDGGKLGFVPRRQGSLLTLEFQRLRQPIHSVTCFFLKSYGPKWKDSSITLRLFEKARSNEWLDISALNMTGVHDKNTSEMYTASQEFPHDVTDGLRLQITLTGGSTFKLMGLAVCSQ